MLDDLIQELSENFEYVCNKIDKDKFKLTINNDIQVNITKIEDAVYFHSPIIKCPNEKKEQIYTHVMKANLLGQGTGQGTIGIDKDEKFLTLSYLMTYEDNYTRFKEQIEEFVNYLFYWEEELNKLQQQERIY